MQTVDFDVIVVGAGPAGSTAAARMAGAGLRVLILERYPLPRYKTCGGGVTRRALQKMPLDITPVIRESIDRLVVMKSGAQKQLFQHHRPFMFLVMRDELDFLLSRHAEKCGAKLMTESAVTRIEREGDIIYVATRTDRFSCRFLLGADGVNSIVANQTGLARGKQKILALEYEVARAPGFLADTPHSILIDYGAVAHGYLWVFPKHDHFSIGVGSFAPHRPDLRPLLAQFLAKHNLQDAVLQTRGHHLSFGGTPLSLVQGGIALVGDAAGLVEPFGGEGIYYALWSGELAAQHVIAKAAQKQYDLTPYQKDVDTLIMPELAMLTKVNHVFYDNIDFIHGVLARYPQFMHRGFGVLEGEKSYSKVYPVLQRVLSVQQGIRAITRYFG